MGKGWTHSWSARLKLPTRYNTRYPASIAILLPDGSSALFLKAPGDHSAWTAATGADRLTGNVGGAWQFYRAHDDSLWSFDDKGWLTKLTLRNGWSYSILQTDGKVLSVANSFGRQLGFGYRSDGRLGSVTLPDGNTIHYDYNVQGSLSSVKVNSEQTRTYSYDNTAFPGLLTAVGDAQGHQILGFTYNAEGALSETARAEVSGAYRVSYAGAANVGSAGMLVSADTDNSNWYKASVTTTDPHGNSTTRQYRGTAAGVRLVGQNNARVRGTFKEELNADLLPASEEDFKGNKTSYQWNTSRQLIAQVVVASNRAEARRTQVEWHDTLSLPTRITESGRTTQFSYDSAGNLVGAVITDTVNNKTYSSAWAYGPNGLPYSYTDAAGRTLLGYDALGNLNKVTDPQGRISQYTHDGAGRVLTATEPSGLLRNYSYNPRGQLSSFSAGGLSTHLTYLPDGMPGTVTFANGYAITYQYDGALRVNRWSDNRGNSGQYMLDAWDNRTSESIQDGGGRVAWQVQRSINSINRVSEETLGSSQSTAWTYDANGDLATGRNGLGQTTTLQVDGLRRLAKVTDPLNASATLGYNALDAVTSAQDFKGVTTTYTRDALGNAKAEATPDAGNSTATYDALGLIATSQDATGRSLAVQRDALGRPTQLKYGASAVSTLRYDLPGNTYNGPGAPQASVGQLSEIQDPGVTTQYQRDILGRVLRKTQILASGDTRSMIHAYVPAGQGGAGELQAITYPSGKQATYLYDSTGQITGLQWNGQPLVTGLAWSPLGQPTAWQWPGFVQQPGATAALAEQRSYNTAGQLASSQLLNLSWDAAGRISLIQQQHMLPGTAAAQQAKLSSAFSYDAVGRLTASAHSAPAGLTLPTSWSLADTIELSASGYAWDANGNRTQVHYSNALASGTSTLQRNYQIAAGSNRLQGYAQTLQRPGSAAQTSNVAFSYDAAGALVKKGDRHLHYGADGRIAKAGEYADASDARAVSYVYNALGQRVLKSDARGAGQPITVQTLYAEDGMGSTVLGQYANQRSANSAAPAGQSDSTEVIYLPTASGPMPIAAEINGRLYAIHTDHLNTPRRLTNQQGQVAWQWLISGFGEVRPTTGDRGYGQTVSGPSYAEAVKFDLRYPGQVFDEETGLSYNLHRYYDAATGRYVQADPIGLAGGWNRFGYVANNPLNDVDPQGLHPVLGRLQGLYYRYGPAITEFIAGASGVNGAVASPAAINPLVAQIPTGVSRMTPIARGIAEGVESGAFCSARGSTGLYRAVGPEEFNSIMKTKQFSFPPNGSEMKQFGFQFDEVLKFSNFQSDYAAIIRVDIPTNILGNFNITHGQIDPFIFRSGVLTIQGIDDLNKLNQSLRSINHAY
ncbi:RHS repeat-associated core domain-containing protein [Delftia tsuruhatensis]|nr:RHS repeat-associated core domain-containing protein [Delftia tsuruhatensis]